MSFRALVSPCANDNFGAIVMVAAFCWPLPGVFMAPDLVSLLFFFSPVVMLPLWAVLGSRVTFGSAVTWLAICLGWVAAFLGIWAAVSATFLHDGEWMLGVFLWFCSTVPWMIGVAIGGIVRLFRARSRTKASV